MNNTSGVAEHSYDEEEELAMQAIAISKETRARLESLSEVKGLPVETLVEQALSAYETQQPPERLHTRPADGSWPELDAVFGILKDNGEDTFEFLRRVREGG